MAHPPGRSAQRRPIHPSALRALAGLLALSLTPVRATEPATCQPLRDQRDALASQAMEQEIALVHSYRLRRCPALTRQADGANALDRQFPAIDFNALLACRRGAERDLERHERRLHRNRLGFWFYTPQGAALARQADALSQRLIDEACP
jgi:hypothetical protein